MYKKNNNVYRTIAFYSDHSNYGDWTDLWGYQIGGVRENFFVGYALDGQMNDTHNGLRSGLPERHNLCNSPVKNPSPLNSEGHVNCGI